MHTTPAVSVLFPVFNAENSLAAALQSLSAQSLTRWECIAVDDGSSDNSSAILADYARADPRVVHLSRPHAGIVAALNAGLAHASAPVIARFDADDLCHPARLDTQLDHLTRNPDIDVVSCRVSYSSTFGSQGGFAEYVRWTNSLVSPHDHWLNRFIDAPVVHPTIMARRSVFDTCGAYRSDPPWPEDFELWLRWMHHRVAFAKVTQDLYTWTDRPERLSRCDPRYDLARFYRCKASYLARGPLAGCNAVGIWGAGRLTRKRAELLTEFGVTIQFYVDIDPRRIGTRIHRRPVLSREELADAPDLPLVAYVASRGARDQIRHWLRGTRYVEGDNFWCAA